jgi:hypothetical protein
MIYNQTSTTLYITCIAGRQYNFIHITRICLILLMTSQGASIISFISLEFCLILLMTLSNSSKITPQIRVPITPQFTPQTQGPKWRSHITLQIRVPNRVPKLGSQIGVPNGGVPNRGPKSGSQTGVLNRGPKSVQNHPPNKGPYHPPNSGSQMEVPYHPPNQGPKSGSQIGVLNRGPKSGS